MGLMFVFVSESKCIQCHRSIEDGFNAIVCGGYREVDMRTGERKIAAQNVTNFKHALLCLLINFFLSGDFPACRLVRIGSENL